MRTSPRTSSRLSVRFIERHGGASAAVTTGLETAIASVFTAFEAWLVSTGATASMLRLAWAVLTVLWLGHVAASARPGQQLDLVEVFGRLLIAGGLLTAVGPLTQTILTGFDALRDAGAAVLQGLIGQSWAQFVSALLGPQMTTLFGLVGAWFAYPWALAVLAVGLLCGVVLFAIGVMVYLAILFFAYLTLLLAIFLAPLALALLAAPATQRWTARWAVVVVRTGLVVFCVRVIHAATLYLAVIAPVRGVASGFQQGLLPPGRDPVAALGGLLLALVGYLFAMLVGTGVGVYAMLRAEHLVGQFVDGAVFGQGVLAGPMWLGRHAAGWVDRHGRDAPEPNAGMGAPLSGDPWGGGAQEATVVRAATQGRL